MLSVTNLESYSCQPCLKVLGLVLGWRVQPQTWPRIELFESIFRPHIPSRDHADRGGRHSATSKLEQPF